MANIAGQQPIRWQLDKLATDSSGLLVSKTGYGLDCSQASKVTGFVVDGSFPSKSSAHVAFNTGEGWFRLNTSGQAEIFSLTTPDIATIRERGNTPAELSALKDVPALAGKVAQVAIGLYTSDTVNAKPTMKLGVRYTVTEQTLQTTKLSPVYSLGDGAQIVDVKAAVTGDVIVSGQVLRPDGTQSPWLALSALSGEEAQAVQFRGVYTTPVLNGTKAEVPELLMTYSTEKAITRGDASGEVYTITEDWYIPVRQCRLTVRHSPLDRAILSAAICFRVTPKYVRSEQLGIGTGRRQTFALAHGEGVKYDSVRITVDGVDLLTGYEVNTEVGRVTCTVPEGSIVAASYTYGYDREVWQMMSVSEQWEVGDYDQTEFRYVLPDTEQARSVCAVKLILGTTTGRASGEYVGMGSGIEQSYKLRYRVKENNIRVYGNGAELSTKNWALSDNPQYIKIAAASGVRLTVTYDWLSENPNIYQLAAVFAE